MLVVPLHLLLQQVLFLLVPGLLIMIVQPLQDTEEVLMQVPGHLLAQLLMVKFIHLTLVLLGLPQQPAHSQLLVEEHPTPLLLVVRVVLVVVQSQPM